MTPLRIFIAAAVIVALWLVGPTPSAGASNTWTMRNSWTQAQADWLNDQDTSEEYAESLRFERLRPASTVVAEVASEPTAEAASSSQVASVEIAAPVEQVLTPITRQEAIEQGGGVIDTVNEPEAVVTCSTPAETRVETLIVSDTDAGLALPGDVELIAIIAENGDGTVTVDVVRHVAEGSVTVSASSLDLSNLPATCTVGTYTG